MNVKLEMEMTVASFLAFLPRGNAVSMSRLEAQFITRGIACRLERERSRATIDFAGSSDLLYLSLEADNISRIELCPDYSARPSMHDSIFQVLDTLGYEHLDEDDPRF